jgi:broad specificity phosphatase PhoE
LTRSVSRLLLLRHAESEWNAQRRWQGIADPPLSPLGQEQARLAGELLRPAGFTAVVSSGLLRARATAQPIAATLGIGRPVGIETDLREYDLGAWSGLTGAQIEARWPGEIAEWREGRLFATPGGEQRDLFLARISAAVARVAGDRPGETVLVITHGGLISALYRALTGGPQRFSHLSGVWITGDTAGVLQAGDLVSLLDASTVAADSGEATALAPIGSPSGVHQESIRSNGHTCPLVSDS